MNTNMEPEKDVDLDAYIDDQLGPGERIAVEAYLSRRPAAATQVMADLRTRDELRFALADLGTGSRAEVEQAARHLQRGLLRSRIGHVARPAVVIGLLIATGWFANDIIEPLAVTRVAASPPVPTYVADAIQAYETTALRLAMDSQVEVPHYDSKEIRAATGIVMPALPKDWRVLDVQVFPSQFGPSVAMAVSSKSLGVLSLVAVRPGTAGSVRPTMVADQQITSAYFQVGEVAYTLVADGNAVGALRASEGLAAQFAYPRPAQQKK